MIFTRLFSDNLTINKKISRLIILAKINRLLRTLYDVQDSISYGKLRNSKTDLLLSYASFDLGEHYAVC